jgi:hypothetical protein
MRFINPLTAIAAFASFTMAQEAPVAPKMTLLYSMEALLGDRFSLGPIPTGQDRVVIPIVGGTFTGPRMNGSYITSLAIRSFQLLRVPKLWDDVTHSPP